LKPQTVKSKRPNLRHLEGFLIIVNTGTVAEAARQMNLSQPAVSLGIRALERALGCSLFQRRKTGMYPTEEGTTFYRRSSGAFNRFAAVVTERSGIDQNPMRRITTSQLRALMAVAEQGSFVLAADREGLATPTLHRAARDLERILGVALFERTSYGVKPTRVAAELARQARLFFYEIEQGVAEIAALGEGGEERCVIGAMPLARSHLVPTAVEVLVREHPSFRVSIVGAPYHDLTAGLRDGRIDFLVGALRGTDLPADIEEDHLFDDPLSLLMRPNHPLAGEVALREDQLAAYPWIVSSPPTPLRARFEALFQDSPVPQDLIECNALGASRVMLMESDRLMLLSDAEARYEREAGHLVSKPLPGGQVKRPIGLTIRCEWRPTPLQGKLVEKIRYLAHAYG